MAGKVMPLRWLGRTVTRDGKFSYPARFKQFRAEDYQTYRFAVGAEIPVEEDGCNQLYRIVKQLEFVIKTSPW